MGINAGIKVIRRITDEHRWKDFLRAVIEYFKDEVKFQMKVKIDFDAPVEPSSCKLLRQFHLTEAFNFVPGDKSTLTFWNTEFQNPNHLFYIIMNMNDKSERRIKEEAALKEAAIAKLNSEAIRLNYTDVDLDQLVSSKYLDPEQAIVFNVGEGPELPRYAHHFKGMESKINHSGTGGHLADCVMLNVYKLLEKFFPNHTKYWTEFDEEALGVCMDLQRVSQERQEHTDQFYKMLLDSVKSETEK